MVNVQVSLERNLKKPFVPLVSVKINAKTVAVLFKVKEAILWLSPHLNKCTLIQP